MPRNVQLTDKLYEYLVDHSVREHPVLALLRAETAKLPHAGMQIGADQGQFMALLAKLIGARRCIEVGVFTGYSSLAVALALPDDGRIIACDVSEEWTAIARRHWEKAGVAKKIDLRLGRATATLDQLLAEGGEGRYDFAFIDADKTSYRDYFERCLRLLRANGLIAIDNTLWSGDVADPSNTKPDTVALRELNDALHRDERVDIALLPLGDGVTLARKR
ncbi:MAG TPA: class I SAM-dependent methyltransferase [Usitatibacter sp.]|nr:class I SAM-dependent methyltransferase [Usitatibacter sp.]